MADHKYQLVVQFAAATQAECSELVGFMQEIEKALADRADAVVDGYDCGLGEFNIFIHTNSAIELFEDVGEIIGTLRPDLPFSAGYRAFDEETYTSLYPRSNSAFTVS